jgi:hypothetical protein
VTLVDVQQQAKPGTFWPCDVNKTEPSSANTLTMYVPGSLNTAVVEATLSLTSVV